jgi:hypothetical protein
MIVDFGGGDGKQRAKLLPRMFLFDQLGENLQSQRVANRFHLFQRFDDKVSLHHEPPMKLNFFVRSKFIKRIVTVKRAVLQDDSAKFGRSWYNVGKLRMEHE